jgi:dynein heavy chain
MTEMKDVSDMLYMLKNNLKHIESTVHNWKLLPLFDRAVKPMLLNDFMVLQRKIQNIRISSVKEAGHEIHRIIKDTNKKLKISQGLSDWKCYVEFVNNVVVDGLVDAVAASIRAMAAQVI